MERIRSQREAEVVQAALDLLPGELSKMLSHIHFFFGDPIFSGLHEYGDVDPKVISEQTSYRDVAHFCAPYNLPRLPKSRRHPTVVLPSSFLRTYRYPVPTIVHELGHALHWMIDLSWKISVPTSSYAMSNDMECFAEFFAAWTYPMGAWVSGGIREWVDQTNIQYDPESIWPFDRMADGLLLP